MPNGRFSCKKGLVTVAFVINISPLRYNYITLKKRIQVLNQKIFSLRPGQRGLNEHSNGLLRRNGLPKQMDFTNISQNYLSAIADKRNKIPKKSLNYQSPCQVFLSYLKSLT